LRQATYQEKIDTPHQKQKQYKTWLARLIELLSRTG